MDMKRFFLYFITIAALALAGCGGGGGGGGTNLTVGDEQATQDLIDALETDRDTAQGERDTAQGERDTAQGERDTAQGERDTANMALGNVRLELGLADDADIAAILAAIMGLGTGTAEDPIYAGLRTALGLADDADRAAILAAVEGLGPDPGLAMDLADVRTALGLPDDADGAAILAAIMGLGTAMEDPVLATLRTALGLPDDADRAAILAAVQTLDMDATRDAGDLAAVRTALGVAADADEAMILAAIMALGTDTSEDPLFASLRTALGLAPSADRGAILTAVRGLVAEDERTEDAVAAKKAPAIADPDGDGMLGENSSTVAADDDIDNPMRPSKMEANAFAVVAGGIEVMATMSIGIGDDLDRLGMPDTGVDDDDEFVMTAEGTKDGFARNRHDRTVDKVTTDEVTVFDNRDDPEDVAYRVFYDEDGDDDNTNAADLNNRKAVTSIDEAGELTLDISDIDGNHGLFSAMALPTGEDQTYTYMDDDPSTMEMDEETRGGRDFKGMFNGVPGKFACTGNAACTAGTDSMGRLDSLGGTWTFTPDETDEDADPPMIADAEYDADYLAFGFWLRGTETRTGTKYSIGTFATGSMPFAVGNDTAGIPALVGTATYSGPAAGMFVMKTDIDDDNMGPVATEAGKFTADTTLEAKFGDATMTADDFTIEGMVENFVLTNYEGTPVDNKWSLTLNAAAFANRSYDPQDGTVDDITGHDNTFSGTTTGVEKGTDGRWNGTFYGENISDIETTSTVEEQETGYPTGVAGEFIGHFETGHAIGAYGADLDP